MLIHICNSISTSGRRNSTKLSQHAAMRFFFSNHFFHVHISQMYDSLLLRHEQVIHDHLKQLVTLSLNQLIELFSPPHITPPDNVCIDGSQAFSSIHLIMWCIIEHLTQFFVLKGFRCDITQIRTHMTEHVLHHCSQSANCFLIQRFVVAYLWQMFAIESKAKLIEGCCSLRTIKSGRIIRTKAHQLA